MEGKVTIMEYMTGTLNFIYIKHKYRFVKKLKILKIITHGGKVTNTFGGC